MQHLSRYRAAPPSALRPLVTAIYSAFLGLGIATVALSPTASFAADTNATISKKHFSIPAGTLSQSLYSFASNAGITLSFDPALTNGLRSTGLNGSYTIADGLATLLAGSRLEAVPGANGGYLLRKQPDASEAVLPSVTVTGLAERNGVTESTGSYAAKTTGIAGKLPMSAREVPQTVSVVTRQQIEDQALTSLHQTLEQVPGIALFQGTMLSSRYLSRGFEITNVRVDGATSLTSSSIGTDIDMTFYDHIEVLRGADGLFGGASEPGGAINLVRKKPTASPQILAQVQAGSWKHRRADLDVSGPLNESGSLRGRAVVAQQDKHFFFDAAGAKRSMLYGVIEADLQPQTMLTLGASYDRNHSPYQGYGLPRLSTGGDAGLARSIYLSGADDHMYATTKTAFLRLDHGLGSDWKLSLNAQHLQLDADRYSYYFWASGGINPGTGSGVTDRGLDSQRWDMQDTSVDISLRGTFGLADRRHEAVLGADWHRKRDQGDLGGLPAGTANSVVPNVYAFNPALYRYQPTVRVGLVNQTEEQSGVYGVLRMHVSDPLKLIVGGRLSRYTYDYSYDRLNADGSLAWDYKSLYKDRNVLTPYAAATYDLGQWTAYGSIAETFKSQASNLRGPQPGTPLDPVTGRNYELGLKGEHAGGRLRSAFALYHIERKGAAVRDAAYPQTSSGLGASCCYLGDGHIVSRGFDAELSGEVLSGLQMTMGYTYNDNRDRNAVSAARYQALTPKHQLKMFASYRLPRSLGPWKIGGGARVQGVTAASGTAYPLDANGVPSGTAVSYRFTHGGYTVWNAFAEYELSPTWTATLNLNNLTDKRYYSTVGQLMYGSFYGEPRSAMLTLRGRF